MPFHPSGKTIEIVVGTEVSTNGRSCEAHEVCGRSVLFDDVVVRLRKVQILNEQQIEETAIAAYLVSDGIDQCCVGFLQRHMCKYVHHQYDGVLAQVTEVVCRADSESPMKREKYDRNAGGCCLAVIISSIPADATPAMTTAQFRRTNQLETPPQRRDNESSGSQGEEESSASEGTITDVRTSSEQDDIARADRDKVMDINNTAVGEPVTVASNQRKEEEGKETTYISRT